MLKIEDVLAAAAEAGGNITSQSPLQFTFGQPELMKLAAALTAKQNVDAERWQALTRSTVMTKMGWAGYGHTAQLGLIGMAPDPSGYRHLTVNFWSHRGDEYDPTKYTTEQSVTARMLTELVDCRIKLDREYASYCYGALNGRDAVPPKPSDPRT